MTIDDISQNTNFIEPAEAQSTIIKVIGVGGGGNNAVEHMYTQGIEDVSFVICNTDRQALINSKVPNRLMIGKTGLGAGNKPEVARQAAEDSAEDIRALFNDGTQMVFVTAGMGGGTGTGAGPVVARLARERGLLTIGIVTIPFLFEGQKKIIKALNGAEEMRKYVDALLVINNERLTEIYPDLQFMNAFGKADDTLTIAARGISELITAKSKINIDFEDVNTTLRNGGAAVISLGYGEGENRVTKAIENALNSPLLKDRDILSSKHLLFSIAFNPEAEQPFIMSEANELTNFTSNIDSEVDVIWGLSHDTSLGNKVKITLLAAGFDTTTTASKPISVRPSGKRREDDVNVQPADTLNDKEKIEIEYGKDKSKAMFHGSEANRYIIFTPEQITDDEVIEVFEKNPTYNRDRKLLEELKHRAAAAARTASAPTPEPSAEKEEEKPQAPSENKNNTISFI